MSNIVTTLGADVDVVNVVVDDDSQNFYSNVFVAEGNFYVFFTIYYLTRKFNLALFGIRINV